MYTPVSMRVDDDATMRAMVAAEGSAWLVTATDGEPHATLVPILWRGDRVLAHMAGANPHWRTIGDGSAGLMIVTGAEAYVSPSWYPSKAEHAKVVPTWNYLAVHLRGTVRIHHDPEWIGSVVSALTDHHEQGRNQPWQVSDAPADYVDSMLRAIVGIELTVTGVDAKAKLSQNRSEADRAGVLAGLEAESGPASAAVAAAMRSQPPAD